jgi:hypothetical protein
MKRFSWLGAAFIVAGLCPAAQGQAPSNANWPCVQNRMPMIAAGMVWSGPDPQEVGPWQADADAASLAQRLASRRTRLEEVSPLIDEFLGRVREHRGERLTRVFAGVLEIVNTERSRVIAGIERYARGQGQLAERIRKEADEISAAKDEPAVQLGKDFQDIETRFQWDKRIFEERAQALRSVCDTPVLLEQHLFEIARRIQERL